MNLPHIDISRNCGDWPEKASLMQLAKKCIQAASDAAGLKWLPGSELSLLFTNDREVRAINRQWRQIDKPTNVLSFPGEDIRVGETAGIMIGDIVFAFETVSSEAKEQTKPFDHHLAHLLVHGFLHLFGYDHLNDEDAARMEKLETGILAAMKIPDPYKHDS